MLSLFFLLLAFAIAFISPMLAMLFTVLAITQYYFAWFFPVLVVCAGAAWAINNFMR